MPRNISIASTPYEMYDVTTENAPTIMTYKKLITIYMIGSARSWPVSITEKQTMPYARNEIAIDDKSHIPSGFISVMPFDIHIISDMTNLTICGNHMITRPVITFVKYSCVLVTGIACIILQAF